MIPRLAPLTVFALLLSACATSQHHAPAANTNNVESTPLAVAVTSPSNYATDNLNATAWVQTSIGHDAIFMQTYRSARQQLATALADPSWNALVPDDRVDDNPNQAAAVILDIDETVLDNSPYQARLVRSGTSYDDATWANWVREESARALPGAVEFTQYAASHGVQVFYLSNRDQSLAEATLANLRKVGFPVSGPEAFLGLGSEVAGCTQQGHSKVCRRKLVDRDYRVLMMFGDQIGDFMALPDGDPSHRKAAADYMGWFGQRWFMLPNPTYGSWLPPLFGNDWSKPTSQRHQEKLESLQVQ